MLSIIHKLPSYCSSSSKTFSFWIW